MLFNSLTFLIFAILFFAGWPFVRQRSNVRWIYITAASLVFYGWWNPWFLFLILGSGIFNYCVVLAIVHWPTRRTVFLMLSLVGNLGPLVVFKYLHFFLFNTNLVLQNLGIGHALPIVNLILPLGISFYTFQAISYTIDVFRGQVTPTRNIFHFLACFVMFPHLVAGPIVRAGDLLRQIRKSPPVTEEKRWDGMTLIAYGLFKKAVVADSIAPIVASAFGRTTPVDSCPYWWTIMLLFTFQIYCDFSGYSDIARGLAKWMGYEFPLNFDHPYTSRSIREFWSRWHISLSTWFRDYVYIPLGGSHKGSKQAYMFMWITMVVSGLWHGAAWTFIIWSMLHAFYLTVERVTHWPKRLEKLPMGKHVSVLIVFLLVLVAWVFFRAVSFQQASVILVRMASFQQVNLESLQSVRSLVGLRVLLLIALMVARHICVYFKLVEHPILKSKPLVLLQPVYLSAILVACVFLRGPGAAFIYFQF